MHQLLVCAIIQTAAELVRELRGEIEPVEIEGRPESSIDLCHSVSAVSKSGKVIVGSSAPVIVVRIHIIECLPGVRIDACIFPVICLVHGTSYLEDRG